ncbi:unnamed protein product [Dovyalis caffra]|uniref:Uncharacterized protein n=1 Tax=Dovyalis caffra TaxID=77055 RepID=A0AAV1R4T8_9ROSI|nr:unnamed protein product [Dovyalis caffra]
MVSYNSIILVLGLHFLASKGFEMFEEILQKGFKPDQATFSVNLSAVDNFNNSCSISCFHIVMNNDNSDDNNKNKNIDDNDDITNNSFANITFMETEFCKRAVMRVLDVIT